MTCPCKAVNTSSKSLSPSLLTNYDSDPDINYRLMLNELMDVLILRKILLYTYLSKTMRAKVFPICRFS